MKAVMTIAMVLFECTGIPSYGQKPSGLNKPYKFLYEGGLVRITTAELNLYIYVEQISKAYFRESHT